MSTMIPFRQIDGSVRDVDLVLENDVEGFMLFRPRTDRGVKALQAVLQHVGGRLVTFSGGGSVRIPWFMACLTQTMLEEDSGVAVREESGDAN